VLPLILIHVSLLHHRIDAHGKVRIWGADNPEHILKNEFQPFSGTIKDLAWTSDNQRIIVGGEGKEKSA
jgi:WD repeat-containing protein 1 (actin-interacting protein 1)